jgi:xanthosine utilization system XapX-like protein
MKLTDLKPEHFANGQTFTQKTLSDYIAAREVVRREFLTRYLLCLLCGVAVGFVVLLFVQGFARVFLVLLSVMIGALVGTKLTAKGQENLKQQAEKLCLSHKSLRAAKKHLKDGTVAWSENTEA